MQQKARKPGYALSVLTNKCPRCREGFIYKEKSAYKKIAQCTKMEEKCPVCGQPTELEVGFYYGTGYVSYALAVGVCIASCLLWYLTIGFSLDDNRFFWWMGLNAALLVLLQPFLMRLSRTLWLSWFVKYDPEWKKHPLDKSVEERIIPEQMGNW
jgi:endogenous inhibitor of DNA gyrase (YacG/DUF329 family)